MEKMPPLLERITRKKEIKFNKNHFELQAWNLGSIVCGIDEVGRGCLAGPVVSAAVIVPAHTTCRKLKDSKLLTESERRAAFAWIEKNCFYGIGITSPQLIDLHNIWHATLMSMKRAVVNLLAHCPLLPTAILVDAMPLTLLDTTFGGIAVKAFPDGERKSISIAAASITAKVKRDQIMQFYDAAFPGYLFAQHKGYATEAHKSALVAKGPSIAHRKTFLKNLTPQQEPIFVDKHLQQLIV